MAEIIKSLADLLWPIIALICLFLLRPLLHNVGNSKNIRIKVGETELTLGEATSNIGTIATDLQAKIAELSATLDRAATPALASSAEREPLAALGGSATIRMKSIGEGGGRKRILWVDDYPSNNAFLVARLRSSGYRIDLSGTTKDALTKLSSHDYGLVITDLGRVEDGIERPMAGRELITAIRAEDPDIPCLVFASARAIQKADELRAAGATAVTSSGTEVIQFVMTLMSGH